MIMDDYGWLWMMQMFVTNGSQRSNVKNVCQIVIVKFFCCLCLFCYVFRNILLKMKPWFIFIVGVTFEELKPLSNSRSSTQRSYVAPGSRFTLYCITVHGWNDSKSHLTWLVQMFRSALLLTWGIVHTHILPLWSMVLLLHFSVENIYLMQCNNSFSTV